jgi:UDP-N-acetylmuramyl tripeptide synthase
VLLAKNPASCVAATRQILSDPRIAAVAIMVNDRVADGRDVSWIWDGGLEAIAGLGVPIIAGGLRAPDVALRFRYAGGSVDAVEIEPAALLRAVERRTQPGSRIAVLATYTSMLEFRRAVLGSKRDRVEESDRPLEGAVR